MASIIDDILKESAERVGGLREFTVFGPSGEIPARANLTPELLSAEGIVTVRELSVKIGSWRGSSLPVWRDYLPKAKPGEEESPSLSPVICIRIAWAKAAEVELGKVQEDGSVVYERLKDLDFLKLAAVAGNLFMSMTDQVMYLASGAKVETELEALEEAGEDSTSTD